MLYYYQIKERKGKTNMVLKVGDKVRVVANLAETSAEDSGYGFNEHMEAFQGKEVTVAELGITGNGPYVVIAEDNRQEVDPPDPFIMMLSRGKAGKMKWYWTHDCFESIETGERGEVPEWDEPEDEDEDEDEDDEDGDGDGFNPFGGLFGMSGPDCASCESTTCEKSPHYDPDAEDEDE